MATIEHGSLLGHRVHLNGGKELKEVDLRQWLMENPMTDTGDIIIADDDVGVPVRLGVGTNGHVLTVEDGKPAWKAPATGGESSQGADDKVNVADGKGGWKATYLEISTSTLRHKDTNNNSGITIDEDGKNDSIEIDYDEFTIKSDDPRIYRKTFDLGTPGWIPTHDDHLVNKKYVDDTVNNAVPQDVWYTASLGASWSSGANTEQIDISDYTAASVTLTIKCSGSDGAKRLSADMVVNASIYKHTANRYISDIKVVSFAGVKIDDITGTPTVSTLLQGEIKIVANMTGSVWNGTFNIQNQTEGVVVDAIDIQYKQDVHEIEIIK